MGGKGSLGILASVGFGERGTREERVSIERWVAGEFWVEGEMGVRIGEERMGSMMGVVQKGWPN